MTLATVDLEDNLENLSLEDRLSCLTADLVEFDRNRLFLARLFAARLGQWQSVDALCVGLPEIERQLQALKERFVSGEALRVTWLESPDAVYGEGFCIILFLVEALHWETLAVYNKQLFLSNQDSSGHG